MFEKEAEEYANGKGHEHYNYLFEENAGTPATFANWCFKDGAEFGYNKAKEEMQKQGLALQSDMDKTIEQNIQLKKQIEKMKCCFNCKHSRTEYEHCRTDKHEKWEIKEND